MLVTSKSTPTGPLVTIHSTHSICGDLIGRPNTSWLVPGTTQEKKTPGPTTVPRSIRPKPSESTLVSLLNKSLDPTPHEDQEPVIFSNASTQTDPVVLLDTGVGRPPALFSATRVSTIQIPDICFDKIV